MLASGGTFTLSLGTVAWLQVDLEGFRELAGARIFRLDAVPGVRVRPWRELPVEAGAGVLVAFTDPLQHDPIPTRLSGVLQLFGHF